VAELLKIETDLTKRGIALVLLSVGGQVSVGVGHAESHLGLHAEGRTDVLKPNAINRRQNSGHIVVGTARMEF
jgi:hypothetical protein